MKIITYTFLAVFLFLSCETTKDYTELTKGIHISNVTILTSENGSYTPYKGHVLIEGEKIIYVDEKEPNIKGTYQKIDGEDKFLTPGLIDSHVHITDIQGMVYHHMEKYPELVNDFKKQVPRSYLYFGFTTLINLGGISEEQIKFFNDQPLKSDLYHTGKSGASVPNGYPMNFAPAEYRFENAPNFIYMESEAENIPAKFDPVNHTPKAVVKRIKESGAIAVKTYYESGFRGMPKLPVPTKKIIEDLQKHSHENGLILTVHGNSLEAHSFLSNIGVDIIAHGLWNWGKYGDFPKDSLPVEIKEVLDMHIEKQIGYTPTLSVIEGERVLAIPEFLDDPLLKKVVSNKMINWYKTEEGQWFAKELFANNSSEEVNKIYGNIQVHGQLVLKYLSDNGGLILFGTDTPSAPTYGNPPGYTGYIEIKMMHEAGISLDKILASATINNAKAFHLDSLIGSVAVGKRANMILMTKDPLNEVVAYDNIETVIMGGSIIERKELSAQK